jgi:hypothetical protein
MILGLTHATSAPGLGLSSSTILSPNRELTAWKPLLVVLIDVLIYVFMRLLPRAECATFLLATLGLRTSSFWKDWIDKMMNPDFRYTFQS